MFASELVTSLEDLISKHGDHRVVTDTAENLAEPEYNDDDDDPVFVIDTF